MIYPDFAFSTATQYALFIINSVTTILTYYWGTTLILQIYQREVSFNRKLLFSLLPAMLLYIIPVYVVCAVNNSAYNSQWASLGLFANLVKIMFPLSYFILFRYGVTILQLSPYKSAKIMQLVYVYSICFSLSMNMTGGMLFPQVYDQRGWNYLSDIFMLLTGTACNYVFYRLTQYAIQRYRVTVVFSDNSVVPNIQFELGKNFGLCCLLYVSVLAAFYFTKAEGFQCLYILLFSIAFIGVTIASDYMKIYKGKLENKTEHITILNQSVEEYRGLKHDFANILQTYSGYLSLGDYDKLRAYHQKVLNTTVSAETRLGISQRMVENPSFFALLNNKLVKAQEKGISFQAALMCDIREVFIDELDFNRIMANLLDNAIEAAERTPLKRISLSSQLKADGSKLIILTNDCPGEVDMASIFQSGYTTKAGHMGKGLSQIRHTLHKYGNSTFDLTSYKGSFTVYLELRPHGVLSENGFREAPQLPRRSHAL